MFHDLPPVHHYGSNSVHDVDLGTGEQRLALEVSCVNMSVLSGVVVDHCCRRHGGAKAGRRHTRVTRRHGRAGGGHMRIVIITVAVMLAAVCVSAATD